jgi:hypothetical protein
VARVLDTRCNTGREGYTRCPGVVQASGYGTNLHWRCRAETLVIRKVYGHAHYRLVDARRLEGGTLGSLHVSFRYKGTAERTLGLIMDEPALAVCQVIRVSERRWEIESCANDSKQLLRFGQYQDRAYRPTVVYLHMVCFAVPS